GSASHTRHRVLWVRLRIRMVIEPVWLTPIAQQRLRNLYRLQVCIRCGVSEDSEHRHDLTFVVKCMGYDVKQDKSRTPEFAAPIHGTLGYGRVKLLLRETLQISSCRFSYSIFST